MASKNPSSGSSPSTSGSTGQSASGSSSASSAGAGSGTGQSDVTTRGASSSGGQGAAGAGGSGMQGASSQGAGSAGRGDSGSTSQGGGQGRSGSTGEREMGITTSREGTGGSGTEATRGQEQSGMVQGGGRTNPFTLMRRLSEEMDRMFGDYGFGGVGLFPDIFGLSNTRPRLGGSAAEMGQSLWAPAMDVFRRDNNLVVHAELPGVSPDDVNVDVTDDTLVVSGQRQSQRESGRGDTYRSERSYGSFYRAIPLPENVDPNSVQASFRNGVLEIEIPIPQQQSRSRRVPVRGEGSSGESGQRGQG